MGAEELRIEQLERRVSRLERRLVRLEAGEVVGPPPPGAAAAGPPASPAALSRPSFVPGPPQADTELGRRRGAIPGWDATPPVRGTPQMRSEPSRAAAPPAPSTAPIPPGEASLAPAPPTTAPLAAGGLLAGMSLRDLEERFAGRALAIIGGFALIAAAVFFLSYAFTRGWINEEMRVLIGLAVGMAAFAAGAFFLARGNALMGNVLSAVGLGVFSIALFAGTRLYGLVVPEVGLAGALVAAIAAAVLAIRFDTRFVAVYGLVAALVAPPLVGASPTLLTLAFVAVTLIGTTAVALFRSWRWLPPIAFVLAAPQVAGWLIGDPDPAQALVALAGFWLVNIVAAAGEEVRIRRDDLRPSSATLVLANAVFLLWGGLVVLGGDLEPWRGTFIGLAALAHLLVGGWFLRRQGLEHLFGNLVAGTGVALLAIASFVQLGAPAVPVAWAAEAVALAWLAVRRRHRWSAAAALALGGLALSHLLVVEYPLRELGIPARITFDPPLLHPEGGSLAAVLLAIGVAAAAVPIRWVRSLLAGLGVLVAGYAATFEATGPGLATVLVVIAVAGLLLDRLVDRMPVDDALRPVAAWSPFGWSASVAGTAVGMTAIGLLFSTEFPAYRLGQLATSPFLHPEAASLAIVLAGLLAFGAVVGVGWIRSLLGGIGVLLVAWVLGFEVTGPTLVGLLVVLLPAAVILDRGLRLLPDNPRFAAATAATGFALSATAAGTVAWFAAVVYAIGNDLDPIDWGSAAPSAVPFTDQRALVGALIVAAALAAARWLGPMVLRRTAIVAAIAVAAWVVPLEVGWDVVVVLWIVLGFIALLMTKWDVDGMEAFTGVAALLTAGAAVVALAIVAPPSRLWVVDPEMAARAPLLAGWPLAFVALAVILYLAPRLVPAGTWRTRFELAAGVTCVHLVSVAVVDVFQRMTGGSIAVEELAKQAQVALSVTWTAIGAGTLVIGLARRHPMLRHVGFGLLALATVKVFVIDLAAMDVAYRALVLAGLGFLLLASAYLFTHFRGPRSGASGIGGGPRPVA